MNVMRRLVVLGCLVLPAVASAADDAAAVIRADTLLADVTFFASPACAGRLPGTDGYARASARAEALFSSLGLEPGGDDGGWRQHLPMEANVITACAASIIGADGVRSELAPGVDFACRGFSGAGAATGPVVFVGYGLSLPDRGYDDYAGLDVAGTIVL
ncbi:MAG TPA: hypothetical protein PLQ13_06090, partial [Candidatus Krumholzibacteria bacterium]|nr:hypothetical protein [Candidatus Krumholzibacteria bacterium]